MSLPARRSHAPWLIAALAAACATPAEYERRADRAVDDILSGQVEGLNAERRATVERPEKRVAPEAPPDASASPAAPIEIRQLGLKEALDIAIDTNREYVSQRESLYQTALSLTGTRYDYSPIVSSTLSYVFSGGDGPDSQSASWGAGVSKQLWHGGDLSVSASTSESGTGLGDADTFSSSASIRLTQPLLRGFGHEIAYEALTQAERNLMYAVREFELFREGFSIDVASRYYDLVQQRRALENQRRSLEGLTFARRQAEALYSVDRKSELEVLRARRSELTAQNSLIESEEDYQLALDRFRIFLGLPEGVHVEVRDEAPEFVEVDYDVDSAIEVALKNRLDLLTRAQQIEDVERGLRISADALRPDLSLDASYGLASGGESEFSDQTLSDASSSVALSLELPVNRLNQRNAYRSARIGYARAQRDFDQFRQGVVVEIQGLFRELARRKQSLEIQRQLIADEERNVKISQLRFEQGDLSNRDLVEAQEGLLQARNTLIQEQVGYEIARLELMRGLGILFIDEHGMWTE
jgi:outer membrane protein TolC